MQCNSIFPIGNNNKNDLQCKMENYVQDYDGIIQRKKHMICSTILSTTFNFPSTSVLFMYCKIWSPTFINVPRKMTQNKNGSPNNKKCYFSQKLKIIFNIILIIDLFNEKWLLILEIGATLENVNLHLITRYLSPKCVPSLCCQ